MHGRAWIAAALAVSVMLPLSAAAGPLDRYIQPTPPARPTTSPTSTPRPAPAPITPAPAPKPVMAQPVSNTKPATPAPALGGPSLGLPPQTTDTLPQLPSMPATSVSEKPVLPQVTPPVTPINPVSPSITAPTPKHTVQPPASKGTVTTTVTAEPAVKVIAEGPAEINVNKPATYTFTLRNDGDGVAENVKLVAEIDGMAELVRAQPAPETDGSRLTFTLGSMPAGDSRRVMVELVPRVRGPVQVRTRASFEAATKMALQVRQPKLAVTYTGPDVASYNERLTYKLIVANIGDGMAEDVVVKHRVPTEDGSFSTNPASLGNLPPGESKTIDLVTNATVAGVFRTEVQVTGDGELRADSAAEVRVMRPMLALKFEGPGLRYARRTGTYTIRVGNPGDAAAKSVEVVVEVPPGLEVTKIERRAKYDRDRGMVSWTLPELGAGAVEVLNFETRAINEGVAVQKATAKADGDLEAVSVFETQIVAIADVRVSIIDRSSPVEVNGAATFDIELHNRGTKGAKDVRLVVDLPDSMVAVPGSDYTIEGRQVMFLGVSKLDEDETRTLSFKAKGIRAGDHPVRVTLSSSSLRRDETDTVQAYFYDSNTGIGK